MATTFEEIEQEMAARRVYGSSSPSPAAPPPPPSASNMSATDFFGLLNQMKQYEASIVNMELAKMKAIEDIVKTRVEVALASAAPEGESAEDKIMVEGMKEFIGAFKQARANPIQGIQAQPTPKNTPTAAPGAVTPPVPPNEVEMRLSQETADAYADKIFDAYPTEVLATKRGEISEEQAMEKIMASGANRTQAKQIYDSIMETDFTPPSEEKEAIPEAQNEVKP